MKLTPQGVVKAPRRKPGRGSQVMPDERLAIQRAYLINCNRVRLVRLRDSGRDWEVVMASPVKKGVACFSWGGGGVLGGFGKLTKPGARAH